MTDSQFTRVSISRADFLDSFVQLYNAIKDYDELLIQFSGEDHLSPDIITKMVQDRMNYLELGSVNVKSMELIGAFLRFSLENFQGEKLNFLMPDEPDDDFFTINDGYLNLSKNIEKVEEEIREVEEKIYYLTRLLPPRNIDKIRLMLKAISCFFKSIIRKDHEDMESHVNHIHHLTASKESYFLINDVGRMVRDIYNSLQDFSSHVPTEDLDPTVLEEMPDAIDKLNLVIQRMESAANSTLDDVENLLDENATEQEKTDSVVQSCSTIQQQLMALKEKKPDTSEEVDKILETLQTGITEPIEAIAERLKGDEAVYFRIIGSQSFQDITGQTLKKIINFIEELELNLLEILKKYSGTIRATTGAAEPSKQAHHTLSPLVGSRTDEGLILEGPQDNKDDDESKMVKQADIDNILAEFGF